MVRWKYMLSDSRFWIFLFFIIRLYHITNPPLEVAHNWRQTTVTMPARNFVEQGPDLLYPKVDFAGEKSGITGMEFPLLNYLIYLLSLAFDYAHWYGRLINLVVSCFGLLFFDKLIKKYFNSSVAFHATLLLLFSIWFSYSRKIMPDTFSMSLVIAGLYYGCNYMDQKAGLKNLLLYFTLVLCGILSKLPSGYLLVVLLVFMFNRQIHVQRKIIFSVVSLVIVSLVSLYYFYWVPYLIKAFGFDHFFMGKSISAGAAEVISHANEAFEKFYAVALGYTGFIIFLCGLGLLLRKKEVRLGIVFLLCLFSFLVIVLKSGATFYHHSYYMIPFAPVMALVGGFAISWIPSRKYAQLVILLVAIECIVTNNNDFYIKEKDLAILNLEKDLDRFSMRTDLILINSGGVPTPMYFAHRKGWIDFNDAILKKDHITGLQKKGLRYIVILKRAFGTEIPLSYTPLLITKDYTIYQL